MNMIRSLLPLGILGKHWSCTQPQEGTAPAPDHLAAGLLLPGRADGPLLARRLGHSCSLLRPARFGLLGPWSLKQGLHLYAKVLGKVGEAFDRQVFPPSFDSLGELQGEAHRLGKFLLRPSTVRARLGHTSAYISQSLIDVAGPHA